MGQRLRPHRLPAWLSSEERGMPRAAVSLPAGIYGRNTERAVVRIVDISPSGCRIVYPRRAMIGAFLTIEIAGIVSVEAWVAWTRADEVGLDFAHPVPVPVIDYLLQIVTDAA